MHVVVGVVLNDTSPRICTKFCVFNPAPNKFCMWSLDFGALMEVGWMKNTTKQGYQLNPDKEQLDTTLKRRNVSTKETTESKNSSLTQIFKRCSSILNIRYSYIISRITKRKRRERTKTDSKTYETMLKDSKTLLSLLLVCDK